MILNFIWKLIMLEQQQQQQRMFQCYYTKINSINVVF